MRGAAQGWEADYTEKLERIGFKRGKASPAVFYSEVTETVVVVHGDDFTCLGYEDELAKLRESMEEWYDIKMRGAVGR